MVFQKTLAGLERGRSEFHLGVVLHPDFKPATHGVNFRFAVVDADIFLDSLFLASP